MATAEFSKFAGILSSALSEYHLLISLDDYISNIFYEYIISYPMAPILFFIFIFCLAQLVHFLFVLFLYLYHKNIDRNVHILGFP